jgi:hypothetical protein
MPKLRLQFIGIAATLMLVLAGLIACAQPSQPASQSYAEPTAVRPMNPAADATATQLAFISWATGVLTPDIESIRDADPTKYAQLDAIARAHIAEATQLALIPTQPYPIYTPWPTDTPGPSPTPIIKLGMMDICQVKGQFAYNGCWRGMLSGNLVTVGVGIKGQPYADQDNGWVVIYQGAYFGASDPNPAVYETPPSVGIMGLTSVDNNVLTLIPVTFYSQPRSGPTIYFDLVSHQFLNTDGTPIPTTPVPTP